MMRNIWVSSRRGGTLVTALLTVAVLAMISGYVLSSVSARMRTAQTSAAWKEALTTAESAVDMTVADLTGLLPDVAIDGSQGVALGLSSIPLDIVTRLGVGSNGLDLAEGVSVRYSPAPLIHGGEGAGRQEATIFLDVLPLSRLLQDGTLSLSGVTGIPSNPLAALNGGDLQLIHLRARGTVPLAARSRADGDGADAELRGSSLVWDRFTEERATRPTVTREIEVFLKPVLPYQSAVTSAGRLRAASSEAVFDSFNSALSTASTNGRYDVTKRLLQGDVFAGASDVTLAGRVFGDVGTHHAGIEKTDRITGTVDNNYSQPLPLIRRPTWSGGGLLIPTEISTPTTLSAGNLLVPRRYKFDSITSTLHISRGLLPVGAQVEIWVKGDFTGGLVLDPGVRAKVYVEGNVDLRADRLVNGSERAANLQIYGIPTLAATSTPSMRLELGAGEMFAAIYAPTHNVTLVGAGHFSGAITGATFEALGAAQVHYDESLALNVGPILRYAVASWMEKMSQRPE